MLRRVKAFVAMPFDKRFWPVWKSIKASCEGNGIEGYKIKITLTENSITKKK
jgi:hypothetical protein